MQYTDKTAIENYLNKDIDQSFDDQIDEWIDAMTLQIDSICNRKIAEDTPATFVYDGDNTGVLVIKDCNTVTEIISNDVTLVVGTDVFLYPSNKPYVSRLVLPSGYIFTRGNQNVSVEAKHGMYDEVPADVKLACTLMVAGICNAQILNGKGKQERIGNYTISYVDDQHEKDTKTAMDALNAYKRISL